MKKKNLESLKAFEMHADKMKIQGGILADDGKTYVSCTYGTRTSTSKDNTTETKSDDGKESCTTTVYI